MDRFLGTTTVIEETRRSNSSFLFMKRRGILSVILNCFLIYFIGSLLSGFLYTIPTYIALSKTELYSELLSNPEMLTDNTLITKIYESLPSWINAFSLVATIGTIFVVIYYSKKYEGKRLFSLGVIKQNAIPDYLVGLFVGALMFSICFGIMLVSGDVSIPKFNSNVNWYSILLFFVGFLIQGFSEEILVRGYLFVSAASVKNIPFAVFLSSVFFSFLHYANAGINIIGIVNLFLFGVFACLYFLRRGSIWGIAAVHSTWNFMQGNFFGFSVSGSAPLDSIFGTTSNGSSILFNGGNFGPEGGLGFTIVLLLAIAILFPMKNKTIGIPTRIYDSEFYSA